MKEKLEDFIAKNRQSFDDETPGDKVWKNIESELFEEEKALKTDWSWIWKAAAVIFFACSGYLLWQINHIKQDQTMMSEMMNENAADKIVEEFSATEAYYISEISQKINDLNQYKAVDSSLAEAFEEDIAALDQQYESLKIELSEDTNEQVINALILNLQLRMEILNKQLTILENMKNSESNENNI